MDLQPFKQKSMNSPVDTLDLFMECSERHLEGLPHDQEKTHLDFDKCQTKRLKGPYELPQVNLLAASQIDVQQPE